ncbi:MAG TPA: glycosyltransferase [Nitrospirales bacterium]|nr:glycosyltransferase [Nitrospirales bacterium]
MRVLHCPTDTGGHAWGLSRAERALGVQSDVMVRSSSWLQFPHDFDLRLRDGSRVTALWRLGRFLLHAAQTYDVFHLNWGMSLIDHRAWRIHYWDLPLLKRLGKRIVVTFQGCDVRMKMWSRRELTTSACAECDVAWCDAGMDRLRETRIRKISRYADALFALNPDLIHAVPEAEFFPYASVDVRAGRWHAAGDRRPGPWRILHLPTNRSIKGTRYVESACAALQREGLAVEPIVVERVPHERAVELVRDADVVVDQLLIGWYGAVSVEAMALGKPVLCYLREDDLKRFVPFHDRIPIVRTTKETLADDLRSLLRDPARMGSLGAAGRAFVQAHHDPAALAERTIQAYRGRA